MFMFFFIILLILFLILFYYFYNFYNYFQEKFVVCENKPDGPYKTYCSLIKFNNNVLSAYCKNVTGNSKNNFIYSTLYMDNCSNNDDCYNVNIDNDTKLTC